MSARIEQSAQIACYVGDKDANHRHMRAVGDYRNIGRRTQWKSGDEIDDHCEMARAYPRRPFVRKIWIWLQQSIRIAITEKTREKEGQKGERSRLSKLMSVRFYLGQAQVKTQLDEMEGSGYNSECSHAG